jgi:hypothetical protein
MAVATMIPVLGLVAVFLSLVTGIGAWAVWLYQCYRHPKGHGAERLEV